MIFSSCWDAWRRGRREDVTRMLPLPIFTACEKRQVRNPGNGLCASAVSQRPRSTVAWLLVSERKREEGSGLIYFVASDGVLTANHDRFWTFTSSSTSGTAFTLHVRCLSLAFRSRLRLRYSNYSSSELVPYAPFKF